MTISTTSLLENRMMNNTEYRRERLKNILKLKKNKHGEEEEEIAH